MDTLNHPYPIAVLISGTGSNLQALIQAQQQKTLNIDIVTVISNEPEAKGLIHAQAANIPTHIINHRDYANRTDFDQKLQSTLENYSLKLIVLAGFMRKLTPTFVHHFYGKLINLHPALLPKFKGLNTFQRALDAAQTEHGCTIHFVSPELDAGPIISQARFPILQHDTVDDLQRKTQHLEHRIYPLTLEWFAQGLVKLEAGHVYLKNQQIGPEGTDLTKIIRRSSS